MQKMHNYFFNNEIFDFFRNSFSLITDPLPRMSLFVFLGALFLSYFVYKFLSRFENRFFGYHLDFEDDTYENFIGSTTTITVGPNMLWAVARRDFKSWGSSVPKQLKKNIKPIRMCVYIYIGSIPIHMCMHTKTYVTDIIAQRTPQFNAHFFNLQC